MGLEREKRKGRLEFQSEFVFEGGKYFRSGKFLNLARFGGRNSLVRLGEEKSSWIEISEENIRIACIHIGACPKSIQKCIGDFRRKWIANHLNWLKYGVMRIFTSFGSACPYTLKRITAHTYVCNFLRVYFINWPTLTKCYTFIALAWKNVCYTLVKLVHLWLYNT